MGKILILLISVILLQSCSENQFQKVSTEVFYKRDMVLKVNGVEGEGAIVVPMRSVIPFHIEAKGNLDLFTFTSCHREEIAEDAGNVVNRVGVFKRRITNKREVTLDYRPTQLEGAGGCPIFLGGYEEEKGRHSWGFVDFETSDALLPAIIQCNGELRSSKGVSVCQAREGLIQKIEFKEKVRVSPDSGCELGQTEGDVFEFSIPKGQCVYAFLGESGLVHRLTTLGYEQILIRK